MGPPKAVRTVSQEAFDEMVKENMEDLGMDATEALEDAIQTLTLQGVDLSGISLSPSYYRQRSDTNFITAPFLSDRHSDLRPGSEFRE